MARAKSKQPASKPRQPRAAGGADTSLVLPRVTASARTRAAKLAESLRTAYPDAHCELNYRSPHELLVATILSAQTTDVAVNKATPALFTRFPSPAAFAEASPEAIEPYIRSLGFFRMKARAIHESMTTLCERHGGQVPCTMDELLALRGVARKTANVVLGNAFGINVGFVVDTHVQRLSQRLGLCPPGSTVQAIERYLMASFPQERWCELSHQLIWHGRRACKARGQGCADHPVCREFGTCCERRVPTLTSSKPPRASGKVRRP